MNFGLVVEGPTDQAAYPELIRNIRQDTGIVQVRPCGNKSKLRGIFTSYLAEFHRNSAWQIRTVFVIQDSDCQPSEQIEDRLNRNFDASKFPNFRVEFFATKCDLETWLVADENAINHVSQQRGANKVVDAVGIQLEHTKAKNYFYDRLERAGLDPVLAIYAEVAKSLDIPKVAGLCPSFRRFVEAVRAC